LNEKCWKNDTIVANENVAIAKPVKNGMCPGGGHSERSKRIDYGLEPSYPERQPDAAELTIIARDNRQGNTW